jgi:hypothetical protein
MGFAYAQHPLPGSEAS